MERLKLEELKRFREVISSYSDIDSLKSDIDSLIRKREEEKSLKLNVRFNMEMFKRLHIFDPWEIRVLELNSISNLDELINCNLDELVGITESIREKLDWARKFYDMTSLEEENNKKK